METEVAAVVKTGPVGAEDLAPGRQQAALVWGQQQPSGVPWELLEGTSTMNHGASCAFMPVTRALEFSGNVSN